MTPFMLLCFVLKYFVPNLCFGFLFRAFGLGYRNKKRLVVGLILYLAYYAVVPTALILLMGYGTFTHFSSLVMVLANLPLLLFTTDSVLKTVFLLLITSQVNTTVSVILNMVRHAFSLSYPTLVVMLCVICPLMLWLMLRYMKRPLRFMADHIHAELPTLIAVPLIVMVTVYLIPVYPARNFEYHPIYCTVLMLLVELGFFLFLFAFYRNLKKLTELSRVERKQELLQAEIESYRDYLASARQTRHDARHHNALLLEYLDEGNVTAAKEYLRANQTALADTKLTEYCQNAAANAVLRIYQRTAEQSRIAFAVSASIPESLPLSEPELGTLLSNLLENAVHASCLLPETERRISVRAAVEGGNLQWEIVNSTATQAVFAEGLPQSNRIGGGTGTRSVAAIVKRHGGMLRFSQENGSFTVQLILPLQ
jgi:signal transduction histidine kinase